MAKVPTLYNLTDIGEDDLEDPFGSGPTEYIAFRKLMESVSTFQLITDFVKLFLYILVVIVNVYLTVIITRNPKLKAVQANRLIMHFCIFNLLFIVSTPLFEILTEPFGIWRYISRNLYCLKAQLTVTCFLGSILCGFGLSFYWFINVNCKNVRPFFKSLSDYVISIIYILVSINLLRGIFACYFRHLDWSEALMQIALVVILIFLIVSNCMKKSIDREKNYSLSAANVIIFSWLPFFIIHYLYDFLRYNYTMRFFFEVTLFIPEYLAYGSPILLIICLDFMNKHFKIIFRKSLVCCKRNSSNNYNTDDLFENSDEEQSFENVDGLENKAEQL